MVYGIWKMIKDGVTGRIIPYLYTMELWIPIEDAKLIPGNEYWVYAERSVRKCWYKTEYYKHGYFEYSHDRDWYTIMFDQVKYVIPYTEPDEPDTGEWSGVSNIMSRRDINLNKLLDEEPNKS